MRDSSQITLGRFRIAPAAAVVAAGVLLFIALSVWWLLYDQRLPGGGDPGRHLSLAGSYAAALRDGDIGALFDLGDWGPGFFYPPLVHLVGAVPDLLGLDPLQDTGTIALNLVFVPMLAAGCYLTGKLVYGRWAGVLAAIFALGAPMVLSLFHVFLLDAPLAAAVAIALWALLASDRFSRRSESALAGGLIGLALLVKTTAPLFLVGPIAVMLIGGGWRQWRNLALAAAVALLVAGPYYAVNLDHVLDLGEDVTVAYTPGQEGSGGGFDAGGRLSLDNLVWYGWAAINTQYYLPLLGLLAVGCVSAISQLRRRRHLPELLAGLVVAYLAMSLLSIHDPRYTLPLVVYVAVLATGWIATTRLLVVRIAAIAVLAASMGFNVVAAAVDGLPTAKLAEAAEDNIDVVEPGALTVFSGRGYVVGPPRPDAFWDRLLGAAERDALTTASIHVIEAPTWGTDDIGFDVLAAEYGIEGTAPSDPGGRPDLRLYTWWTSEGTSNRLFVKEFGLPAPCGSVEEGVVPPAGPETASLSVAVTRRSHGGYRRWCDF